MCFQFLKSEDQSSKGVIHAGKDVFENKLGHFQAMKKNKVFTHKRECLV